jgi:uncharacterized coiled-coil protein SlyX
MSLQNSSVAIRVIVSLLVLSGFGIGESRARSSSQKSAAIIQSQFNQLTEKLKATEALVQNLKSQQEDTQGQVVQIQSEMSKTNGSLNQRLKEAESTIDVLKRRPDITPDQANSLNQISERKADLDRLMEKNFRPRDWKSELTMRGAQLTTGQYFAISGALVGLAGLVVAVHIGRRIAWPKRGGEDGAIRTASPPAVLEAKQRRDPDSRDDIPSDGVRDIFRTIGVLEGRIADKEAHIATLQSHLAAQERRTERAEQRLTDKLARLAAHGFSPLDGVHLRPAAQAIRPGLEQESPPQLPELPDSVWGTSVSERHQRVAEVLATIRAELEPIPSEPEPAADWPPESTVDEVAVIRRERDGEVGGMSASAPHNSPNFARPPREGL